MKRHIAQGEGEIMRARDLIEPGETAVVIFTHGLHFALQEDGGGSTGNWKLNVKRQFDRVIICHRRGSIEENDVYIADADGIEGCEDEGRYVIRLKNVVRRGNTTANWFMFGNGSQDPVQYL